MFRRLTRSLATLIATLGVASCGDGPSTATRPSVEGPRVARVAFAPVFAPTASIAASRLADFGITFDRVLVRIVRPPSETVKDTTIAFTPGHADVTLDLSVEVRTDNETFGVSIDYANASGVLFHGEGTVQAHAPDAHAAPQQIQVTYVGPGANAAHITVAPKTSSVVTPSTVNFTVTAVDANNAPVAGVPVSWVSSDPSVATISNAGTLTTTGKRGTVTVTATTPNGVSDNASVTVRLPTSGIVLVSGGGQTGKAGATLAQPGVVRVVASDGAGVAGVSVNFAPPTGGKVGSSSVTTDANGLASTSLTLGGTVGPQSFAAAIGSFSVVIPETATSGDAAVVAVVSGAGQSDTVKHTLAQPFVVRVSDPFGNPAAGVTVSWARTSGSGTVSSATSVTGADGQASITYTLGSVVGTETVSATIAGGAAPATFSAQAIAGAPAAVVVMSGNGQTARIQQALAPFVAKITDADGNPVAGYKVTWTAVNGTLAAATTLTDANGSTSNTMTVGVVAGPASATATAGTASTRFTATVQTGIVSRIAIITQAASPSAAGIAITPAVQVALQDAGGNLTAATNPVTVALGANPSGATLSGTLTRNSVAGVATFDDLKIDKVGAGYTLVITSANAGSVTTVPFTVLAGAAANFVIVAGDGQTGTVNTLVEIAPSVRLTDAHQNPVPGATVTFTPAASSGTVSPSSVVTDANGVATVTSWTLGTVAGAQSVVAAAAGVSSLTFHAIALAGAPAQVSIITQPSTVAQSGIAFATQPAVQLLDAFGNRSPRSGVAITAAIATGGGQLAGSLTATTDTAGRAAFTNLNVSGLIGSRTLSFSSPGLTPATSGAINLVAGPASRLAFVTQPSATVVTGTALATQPVVQLQDASGNAVSTAGVVVTVSLASGAAQLSGGTTATTDASGRATFTGLVVVGAPGQVTLAFSAPGLTQLVSSPITVLAQPPALSTITPAQVDAVFVTIPVVLSGSRFVTGSTTVAATGAPISPVNFVAQDVATLTGSFNITGGAATATASITVTTPQGTSNAIPFQVYSVGTAPLQLGAANGGTGGGTYSLDCPVGSVATGLNVHGGSNVDQIQVICQTVTGVNRTFGSATTTATAGGSGGSPAALTCPANFVLTGLTGFVGAGTGGVNDMIAGICSPIGGGQTTVTASVGSQFATSVAYSTSCPAGMVVTGIQGGAGSLVDRTQIKCQ